MWAQRTATALSPSVQILPGAVPPSEPRGSSVWSGRVQEVLAATRSAPRDLVAEPRLLRPRPLRPVSMNGLEHILFFLLPDSTVPYLPMPTNVFGETGLERG